MDFLDRSLLPCMSAVAKAAAPVDAGRGGRGGRGGDRGGRGPPGGRGAGGRFGSRADSGEVAENGYDAGGWSGHFNWQCSYAASQPNRPLLLLQSATLISDTFAAMAQVLLQPAAVVGVERAVGVVVLAVVAVVDGAGAATTATAHPAASLTGMMAQAGGESIAGLMLCFRCCNRPLCLQGSLRQQPNTVCLRQHLEFPLAPSADDPSADELLLLLCVDCCSYEHQKRNGGGRGNWGAEDGR